MAGIVENNVVKMDWEKDGWLQTSAKKGKGAFIFASKAYPSTTKGEVTVFFTAHTAFIFATEAHTEDEDLWSGREVINAVKGNLSGNFPYDLDEYVPVIDSGEDNCNVAILEEYGIVEHKADIEARLLDVRPYGEEKIQTFF